MDKKKIVIDLDVVTVGLWEKNDERKPSATKFMDRVKESEFFVVTLSSTLNLIEKWDHANLSKSITEFYALQTARFVDDLEIAAWLDDKNIASDTIIDELLKKHIKREDILLILACVITESGYLITFNKKHLKNNVEAINAVLQKHKLPKIQVVHPDEI